MMGGRAVRMLAATCALAIAAAAPAWAGQAEAGEAQRGAGRAGGRAGLPPPGPNMNQQQVQTWIDTYALVQAERELQLTSDQYPAFVTRMTRLQNIRRRQMAERRRLLNELNGLVQGTQATASEETVAPRLRALDELSGRTTMELRQAYRAIDGILNPWQRARFRLFEEQLERRKIELLAKVRGGQ